PAMKGKADLVPQVVTKYGLPQIGSPELRSTLYKGPSDRCRRQITITEAAAFRGGLGWILLHRETDKTFA
ncbi:MAG: hypothetical protein ACXWJ4_07075, partial [Methyloceanibacter sp.]